MANQTIEVPIQGMDCAECTQHVRKAIAGLPGVESVDVYLGAEKAVIHLDRELVALASIRKAVKAAGYSVPETFDDQATTTAPGAALAQQNFTRPVLALLGVVFGVVLFVVVFGEWLGLFEEITARVPWPVGFAIVIIAGLPVFLNVIRAALQRQVISHTLMTLGVIAALAVGEWATAAVVVFFMRVGDYVERFTTERARRAVKDLASMAPQTARVERAGEEAEIPAGQVQVGEVVVVRPGEKIPVDGEVVSGHAVIDQATITGESLPVEAGVGSRVYAATIAQGGSLRLRAAQVGRDTTFGGIIRLVEGAEARRAKVQLLADRFSGYYLPLVAAIAALTFLLRRDPLASAAVLVVACSCSFALATPIAMLASIGAGARRGLMIKGGKYLELLDRADVLLIDKTGTLTLGQPQVTDILIAGAGELPEADQKSRVLQLATSAERYSEHPLAEALRRAARQAGLELSEPQDFRAEPGLGVRAAVEGRQVAVGNRRFALDGAAGTTPLTAEMQQDIASLEAQGKTLLYASLDGCLAGAIAAADTLRPEVPAALEAVRKLGIAEILLLTGDNPRTAASLAETLQIPFRAGLLPEDKIAIVREYQAAGRRVIMVGDGVNDAPALAQADVGIAMGAAGSDVAIEAAHIALMHEDWSMVPEVIRISRRTMRVVRMNIGFTALYNLVGLSLAAFGFLPPVLAAAAQSLPDLGILANSSRLIRD